MAEQYAFRCRACNTLEGSAHAGQLDRPRRCRTCGAGGHFTREGFYVEEPDNWIVLADLPSHELKPILAYHAIGADEINRHVPSKGEMTTRPAEHHARTADESVRTEDVAS